MKHLQIVVSGMLGDIFSNDANLYDANQTPRNRVGSDIVVSMIGQKSSLLCNAKAQVVQEYFLEHLLHPPPP